MLAASLQENSATDGHPTILQAINKQDQWDLKCRRVDVNPWKVFFVQRVAFLNVWNPKSSAFQRNFKHKKVIRNKDESVNKCYRQN